MLQRTSFAVLISLSFLFASCNSNQEKKSENTTENKSPSADFSQMEKKLEQDSLNIELRTAVAAQYYASGQLEKAANHFLRVINQDKKNLPALTNLGNIYYDSHQDDKAIEYYERAVEIDSMNIDMRCDLATCYSNINLLKRSIKILKDNIKINPLHAKSHHNLAVILKRNNENAEADKEMKIYESLISEKK